MIMDHIKFVRDTGLMCSAATLVFGFIIGERVKPYFDIDVAVTKVPYGIWIVIGAILAFALGRAMKGMWLASNEMKDAVKKLNEATGKAKSQGTS